MNKKNSDDKWLLIVFIILGIVFFNSCRKNIKKATERKKNTFTILASTSTSKLDDDIKKLGEENGFNVEIEHYGDLDIVDILNDDSKNYDAVWISNSIWLYMLDNSYLTTNSKSIVIDPVVMAVEKKKAKELGFVDKDIYNKDILSAIKDGKLKYVMSSVTQTNTGATAYLSFLNSLAGSPEVLTSDMLKDKKLQEDLINLFKGVERVSGDENYLKDMYLNGDYNAMINYESSLIELNKELEKNGKEPLYLIYPKDGVAINDMPFAYINNDSKDTLKKERFDLIQSYLRSDEMIKKFESLGYRSWYGGVKENVDKNVFNKEWGIDTTKYLKDMKYPSKNVMTDAFDLYIEKFRKPTHVVFCLDTSGSMDGDGIKELKDAMNYILDYDTASKAKLQFSDKDKITIISFNKTVANIYSTRYGNQTDLAIRDVNSLNVGGATNIYSPSIEALKILSRDSSDDYTKTIILMTDGESNYGNFNELKNYYNRNNYDIPIYSITFGQSNEEQLKQIAELTNGKVFDGKNGLKKAFKEVRSYN